MHHFSVFNRMALSNRKTSWKAATLALALTATMGLSACGGGGAKEEKKESDGKAAVKVEKGKIVKDLDLQSHRGGRGETTEESLKAFEKSLKLGVTTLEFDIVMTKDGIPAVWHDPYLLESKCSDTKPVTPSDPQFPYVGKRLHDLTWDQIQTVTCDKILEGHPKAESVKGNKIAQLKDVFELTKKYGADTVKYNIETKIEGEHRDWSASPEEFVKAIMKEVDAYDQAKNVTIQSFDWRTFPLVKATHPQIPLVMLWDETTWKSYSMWTGDVDYDQVNGDILAAAKKLGVQVLSPGYTLPYGLTPKDSNFKLVADAEFIKKAHEAGFKVVPWTINDPDAMKAQIEAGADGVITDYPTKLREVMKEMKLNLPKTFSAK